MADQSTNTTINDNTLMIYLQKRSIPVLHEMVYFYQAIAAANRYPLPKGSGTQMTFNGWQRIAAASSVLAEQSGNSATTLSSRKVNVTIKSYGRAVKFSDLFEYTSILNVKEGALTELEQSAALTIDNDVQRAVFKDDITQVGEFSTTKLLSAFMSPRPNSCLRSCRLLLRPSVRTRVLVL